MKKLCLLLAVIVSGHSVSAQLVGEGSRLTFGTSLGLLAGECEEIVYRDSNVDDKLSQLLWHFKPMVYFGIDTRYNWRIPGTGWSIFADGIFKFGFPGSTGQMEDRDWMDARYSNFLTHYSVHDNEIKNAVLIDANIGASFAIFRNHLIKMFIAYNYMNFHWAATGGSFLYPIGKNGDEGHLYLSAPVEIGTYKQTWHMLSPGIAFYGEFNRYFNIELYIKMSPVVWLSAKDEHLLRDLVITEEISGGFSIEPGFTFSFNSSDATVLSLSFLYRNISGIRGNGKYEEPDETITTNNQSGAGYAAFDVGFTAKFKLGN
jgi:plasminogen activator